MPLLATLGSLYETKQAPPLPVDIGGLSLTRALGYNLDANYTEQILNPPPYDYPITYYGKLKSNPNRYTSTSTSNSNMTFTNVPPFDTYNANIWASTIIGNSTGVTSGNVTVSSNLVANGNTVISNAVSIAINPTGTEVDIGTSSGYLLRYSRNSTTGQLTLSSNTFINSGSITSMNYSPSGNFLYIYGNGGSRIYNYNIANSTFAQTGLSNTTGGSTDHQLFTDQGILVQTGRISGTYRIITYTANSTTGNLTFVTSVADGSNYSSPSGYKPYFDSTTNYMVIGHSGVGSSAGNAQFNLYNISGSGTVSFIQRYSLHLNSNNTSTIANTNITRNSIYITVANTTSNQLRSYRYTNTITFQKTTNVASQGLLFCPVTPQSNTDLSGLYYNGNITTKRESDGNLTILTNSASYSANFTTQAVIAPVDTRHVYTLTSGNSTLTIYNVTS